MDLSSLYCEITDFLWTAVVRDKEVAKKARATNPRLANEFARQTAHPHPRRAPPLVPNIKIP